jgi:pyrroloquinoline quinone biosynthesis protein E
MTVPRPYALLAEITYRCPLHCPYCSNPVAASLCEASRRPQGGGYSNGELTTEEWKRVISEAAALGVLQIGFSGGEPLARVTIACVGCAMLD